MQTYEKINMKNIKWKKGLFRIWIVGSIVWIGFFLWLGLNEGIKDYGFYLIWVFLTPVATLIVFIFLEKIFKWIYAGFK